MQKKNIKIKGISVPAYSLNTIVVGSGAASLNCADHIHNMGQEDIAIVTEGLSMGTSINAGSDKQTYYKLSVFGKEPDSPYEMAGSLFNGGSMHGDLALIESILSPYSFFRLVQIGVPFPHNSLGGYVGYKTDHDPRQRATSAGPWTSRQMTACLLKEVKKRKIKIFNDYEVIGIITHGSSACGIAALDKKKLNTPSSGMTLFHAENVVFGVGGPGGIYKSSVYPKGHTGAIGLALEAGAKAVNLTESQYGLASVKFRWNVSGTYQQVIPRYISTDAAGRDKKEFLNPYFKTMNKLATDIFLKGYQWPFDPRKIADYGSSLIDILVYIETVQKQRRVYMDFTENPKGGDGLPAFKFNDLEKEAYEYLKNSKALFGKPIDRLKKMNPMAIDLYKQNRIDITSQPLEIAVCAQHNNGGLQGDIWWESNIRHLFPVGEVNGSHGVYRPGGSALNSGQVGSLRAAQRIAKVYNKNTLKFEAFKKAAAHKTGELFSILQNLKKNIVKKDNSGRYRQEFQKRMTDNGAHIREKENAGKALAEAYKQMKSFPNVKIKSIKDIPETMKNKHLALAHTAYLEAINFYLKKGGGSRGSYMVLDTQGHPVLEKMLSKWRYKSENKSFKDKMIETVWDKKTKKFISKFVKRRPVPEKEFWFENVWDDFLKSRVFLP